MKKRFKVPLVLLASTLLAACGSGDTENESVAPVEDTGESIEEVEVSTEETAEENLADVAEEANEEDAEEEVTEVEAEEDAGDGAEDDTEEDATEEEGKTETTTASGDLSDAYTADQTSETDPVPLGEWGEITSYSTESSDYHPVYLRITQITPESKDASYIENAFAEHNDLAEHDFQEVHPEEVDLPADVEWLVVDYEIHYPEDFPTGDYGISESSSSLTAVNPEGGGIPSQDGTSVYLALGTPESLYVDTIETSQPGDTRTARNIYTMVTDYEDFIFKLQYNLPNEEGYEMIYFGAE